MSISASLRKSLNLQANETLPLSMDEKGIRIKRAQDVIRDVQAAFAEQLQGVPSLSEELMAKRPLEVTFFQKTRQVKSR